MLKVVLQAIASCGVLSFSTHGSSVSGLFWANKWHGGIWVGNSGMRLDLNLYNLAWTRCGFVLIRKAIELKEGVFLHVI